MGKMQRDKGARVERSVCRLLNSFGIFCQKVPLSGAVEFRDTNGGDIDVYFRGKDFKAYIGEVKARKDDKGFKIIKKWIGDADFLVIKENREDPIYIFPHHVLMDILDKQKLP